MFPKDLIFLHAFRVYLWSGDKLTAFLLKYFEDFVLGEQVLSELELPIIPLKVQEINILRAVNPCADFIKARQQVVVTRIDLFLFSEQK